MTGQVLPTGSFGRTLNASLSRKEQRRVEEAEVAAAARFNDTCRAIGNIAGATDYTVLRLALLKHRQDALEFLVPDATEWINLAANTGAMNMVRRLAEYEG